ncbi:SDR family oxidoreductase [Ferriphaselus sp. R-1]|uniref:NAD(P)-dependent oxidoreductase n=1 Tax=Ferriphaselus sp. R-1 TaxID=1485544 RepID=UPI000556D8B3|nr:SDR family oxidoreductase [Ferriphaselus sp. R-1]
MTTTIRSVLVIGANGPTGIECCRQAACAGLQVRALVRNPARLPPETLPGIEVVQGDVLDVASLRSATRGMDAVLSALGTPLQRTPVTLLSQGTRNLVQAMAESGTERLLCITGMGAGSSRGHGGFLYDRIILPWLLREIYRDKDRQEHVVHTSGLDWTLIRPAWLTDGRLTGRYRCLTELAPGDRLGRIARADVAHFIVGELARREHSGGTVHLSY